MEPAWREPVIGIAGRPEAKSAAKIHQRVAAHGKRELRLLLGGALTADADNAAASGMEVRADSQDWFKCCDRKYASMGNDMLLSSRRAVHCSARASSVSIRSVFDIYGFVLWKSTLNGPVVSGLYLCCKITRFRDLCSWIPFIHHVR